MELGKEYIDDEETNFKNGKWIWWFVVLVIAVLVVAAGGFTLSRNLGIFNEGSGSKNHLTFVKEYVDALDVALQFFDVQKSGKLVNNRITWRGDSGLRDGKEYGLDLSKGMYDAGDNTKFGFPMAFTATILSWSILEYGQQLEAVNQLVVAQDSLRWITDFLINAHQSPNVLYVQVGDADLDHRCWERPEAMTGRRPAIPINASFPGTDVAAEAAAAMASASIVFKDIDSSYSDSLLSHAQQLFEFADTYRGLYSISVPQVQTFYNSSGFGDELLWGAAWLYHATNDQSYLKYVTELHGQEFAGWGSPTWFSWQDKHAGAQVLLTRTNMFHEDELSFKETIDLQLYRTKAEVVMCALLPNSPTTTSSRTESGLIWTSEFNSLQHPVASAFLAVLFSDYMVASQTETLYCSGEYYSPIDLRNFAKSQADYVLGDNPMKTSYLVGYGSEYPQHIHHRASSIPVNAKTNCRDGFRWLDSPNPNPNIAIGALVGGPFLNETYNDTRRNFMQNEPTTYNSALLVALLSGLITNSSVVQSFT